MNEHFDKLSGEEGVISLQENPDKILSQYPMLKVGELLQNIKYKILNLDANSWDNEYYEPRKKWLEEGLECEILKLGSGKWQKGKVRVNITVEFCPDEIESPLDGIRQMKIEDS